MSISPRALVGGVLGQQQAREAGQRLVLEVRLVLVLLFAERLELGLQRCQPFDLAELARRVLVGEQRRPDAVENCLGACLSERDSERGARVEGALAAAAERTGQAM